MKFLKLILVLGTLFCSLAANAETKRICGKLTDYDYKAVDTNITGVTFVRTISLKDGFSRTTTITAKFDTADALRTFEQQVPALLLSDDKITICLNSERVEGNYNIVTGYTFFK